MVRQLLGLAVITVILSICYFAVAQERVNDDSKPWEKPMPGVLVKQAEAGGAIRFETTCMTNEGEKLRKDDPGYDQCLTDTNPQSDRSAQFEKVNYIIKTR
jgi:hypothetical protein